MGKKYFGRETQVMKRIHIICEGSTEEMFVNKLLAPFMNTKDINLLAARIGRAGHKGGNVNMARLHVDLRLRLLKDKNCFCTTLLDYYGLPSNFPGKKEAVACKTNQGKFDVITQKLNQEIIKTLGIDAARRFIPYIQLHEFEGLLFSDPEKLAKSIQQPALSTKFLKILKGTTPEEVNDSPDTAPSKRIQKLFPGYDKPTHPVLAACNIGLVKIRSECPLFNAWIMQLEALANKSA